MAERLHILMPCCRPQNIPAMSGSLLQCEGHCFELRWHILLQGPEPDPKGFHKINEALEWIRDGWFWTPSDDSIHAQSLFRRLGETIAASPACGAVVFSEMRPPPDADLIASPDHMQPGMVDGSQVFWRREFVGDKRYDFDLRQHEADGQFTMELYQEHPDRFVFVPEKLVRFNFLQW